MNNLFSDHDCDDLSGAICSNTFGNYTCECPAGYLGSGYRKMLYTYGHWHAYSLPYTKQIFDQIWGAGKDSEKIIYLSFFIFLSFLNLLVKKCKNCVKSYQVKK